MTTLNPPLVGRREPQSKSHSCHNNFHQILDQPLSIFINIAVNIINIIQSFCGKCIFVNDRNENDNMNITFKRTYKNTLKIKVQLFYNINKSTISLIYLYYE